MGDIITRDQAEEFLKSDCSEATAAVAALVTAPLNDNQFSALASFVFNVGADAFQHSKMLKLLNQKNYSGAAQEFPKWNHAGGHTLPGLTKRRKEEKALFLKTP